MLITQPETAIVGNDTRSNRSTHQEELCAGAPSESAPSIDFFKKMKIFLKKYGGIHHFHNFATGGASPDEAVVTRRLDRIFHKEFLKFSSDGMVTKLAGIPDICCNDTWALFSISGDSLIRGQVMCFYLCNAHFLTRS